jgi:hypothetical protein
LQINERRNKCGFGCKTTLCKTKCGCRKIIENITPCGCSTCVEGCNKCCYKGCDRMVTYKCTDCKIAKGAPCDYPEDVPEAANKAALELDDVPMAVYKKRRLDDCELCGEPAVQARLYTNNARRMRSSAGQSEPIDVSE